MKNITNSERFKDLERRAHNYKWGSFHQNNWSEWGLLFRFLVIICKLLDNTGTYKNRKISHRKPSAWQKFAGEQLRKGKSMKETGKMWREKK
jgi:hypothetical protein